MDTKQARSWLLANGYHVKPKGRIPEGLVAIFEAKIKMGKIDTSDSGDSDPAGDLDDNQDSLGGRRVKKKKRGSCGFCSINASYKHRYCPGTINQGKMGIWTCWCFEKGHPDVLRV